jgi:nucleoside-triphosphatase THEP1
LEAAVGAAEAALAEGADLLIVNKFGKQEAAGRGFRPVIAEALAQGTDVLVGVNPLNLEALLDFAGDMAQPVSPKSDALCKWITERN